MPGALFCGSGDGFAERYLSSGLIMGGFWLTGLYISPVFCISFLHKSYKPVTVSWFLKLWIRGKKLVYIRNEEKKWKCESKRRKIIMKTRKMIMFTGAAIMAAGMMAGCGSDTKETTAAPTATAPAAAETTKETEAETEKTTEAAGAELSGSISMSGSTSMEKFGNALAESFMEKYPNVTVTVEFTGSSAGVEAALSGASDIGNSSRNLKDEEKSAGAVENIVAIDGIAVAVDPKNTVTDLTKDQLIAIYTGEIKNWSDLGGENMPIVVVGREAGSGTRGAFEEILGIEDKCVYANELDSTGAVMAKVASTPGAIGYISLDAVDDSVIALKLEGAAPSAETIKSGEYFLSRPFVMATKGEISEQNELVQALFDYVYSEEGQELAASVGLITVE